MKPALVLMLCYATTYGFSAWFAAHESTQKQLREVGWVVVSPAGEHHPYRGPIPSGPKSWQLEQSCRGYQVAQRNMLMDAE